jgi:hypothetical protein
MRCCQCCAKSEMERSSADHDESLRVAGRNVPRGRDLDKPSVLRPAIRKTRDR